MVNLMDHEGLNVLAEYLEDVLWEAVKASCPMVPLHRGRQVPWWTPELNGMRARVRNVARALRRSPDNVHLRDEHRELKREYQAT